MLVTGNECLPTSLDSRKRCQGTRVGEQQRVVPRSSRHQQANPAWGKVVSLSKMPSMATMQFKGFWLDRKV